MKKTYPNLELIEYIFKLIISEDVVEEIRHQMSFGRWVTMETFTQAWPDTAGGFQKPGTVSGQMFIDQFTTVVGVPTMDVYAVFFDNQFGYLITNPNEKFFNDLKDRNMKCVGDSHAYNKEEGVTH